jgi:hypothetical protein
VTAFRGQAAAATVKSGGSSPNATYSDLFDDLVSNSQQRFRDGEAERLRSLEIEDEFESRRLLHRKVAGLFAAQNTTGRKLRSRQGGLPQRHAHTISGRSRERDGGVEAA